MIVDLPDTTTTAVNKKLDELREKIGAVAMGRVLTLIIAPDSEAMLEESIEAANDASHEHPSRIIVTMRGDPYADRGYGEAAVDQQLTEVGVKNVLIPRKGKPSQDRRAEEHRKAFRRTIKWRTGCEGRISHLKRGYGWDRGRIGGLEGTRTWVGHGVFAHNLVTISALPA